MRFSINDILLFTVAAAIVFLVFKTQIDLQNLQVELVRAKSENNAARAEITTLKAPTRFAQSHFDFYQALENAKRTMVESFAAIENRYSEVAPRPGFFGFRIIPDVESERDVSVQRWRIQVPREFPVFLRFGINETTSLNRKLDDFDWVSSFPMEIPGPGEIAIPPGDHILTLRLHIGEIDPRFELELDGQPFMVNRLLNQGKISGWTSVSAREPIYKKLEQGTQFLFALDSPDNADSADKFRVWFWFSRTPLAERFQALRRSAVGDRENQR